MLARKKLGFLYLNGLGNGKTKLRDQIIAWWWQQAGLELQHGHVNWCDETSLEAKINLVETQVTDMLDHFSGVVIIGSSAGGSLALNVFAKMKSRNVCAVNAHGRVTTGNYTNSQPMSLYHRANLDTQQPCQSFFDSVTLAETQTIPALSAADKSRLLNLTQLTDLVVPLQCMKLSGVKTHRSFAFGHSGGFIAHFLADRDIIARFARMALLNNRRI